MRKILTIIALSVTSIVTFAQQDAQFSMNMFNRLSINPGYAGTNKALCGVLLYRQQWNNFPGAPKTFLFSLDYGQIAHGGLGLTLDQDALGFDKTFKAKLAYSFHQTLGPGVLGIGLDVGMIQKSLSGNFVAPDGSTTEHGGSADAAIPWNGAKSTTYDLGFGLYYTTFNDKLYVGISALHLTESDVKKGGTTTPSYSGQPTYTWNYDYQEARHYYVMAGYRFDLGDKFSLTPSVLTKTDAASTQLDINAMVKWNKMVFAGVSYRLTDAIVAIVGLEYKGIKFGYSYDITTSTIKNHSSGTHEIMLGYCHKFVKPEKKHGHMNERFL